MVSTDSPQIIQSGTGSRTREPRGISPPAVNCSARQYHWIPQVLEIGPLRNPSPCRSAGSDLPSAGSARIDPKNITFKNTTRDGIPQSLQTGPFGNHSPCRRRPATCITGTGYRAIPRTSVCALADKRTELQGYSAYDTKTACKAIAHLNKKSLWITHYGLLRATPNAAKAGRDEQRNPFASHFNQEIK
jgi:hypothetical protein